MSNHPSDPSGVINDHTDEITPQEMYDGIASGEVLLGEFLAWLQEQREDFAAREDT